MIIPQFTQRPLPKVTAATRAYRKLAEQSFSMVATEYEQCGYELNFCGPTGSGTIHKLNYEKSIGDKKLLLNLQWAYESPDEYLFGLFIIGRRSSALMMENNSSTNEVRAHALAFVDYANEAEAFLRNVAAFGNVGDPISTSYHRQIKLENLEL